MHAIIRGRAPRRTTTAILLLTLLSSWGCGPTLERRFQAHIDYLASDRLEGRGVGTAGIERAAAYIADKFDALGLEPVSADGSYFQTFEKTLHRELTDEARLAVTTASDPPALNNDFVPMNFSSNDAFEGEVVFCGYGIVNKEKAHDDFVHLDVAGKVAVVLRGEPPSWADENGFPTRHAADIEKVYNAKDRGAAAVLLVNAAPAEGEGDSLDPFHGIGADDYGIPVFQIARATADDLLQSGDMGSLMTLQEKLDAGSRGSGTLAGVYASGRAGFAIRTAPTSNVVGVWRGEGPLADEYVVIGAHYDHLGKRVPMMRRFKGGKMVREARQPEIHNGADDNASGTSGLIETARLFAHAERPARSILFVAFTAEESGLHGSKHFMTHPPVPAEKMVAMLNMDMIGRMPPGANELQVFSVETGEGFSEILDEASRSVGLVSQAASEGGLGRSDHAEFVKDEIPSMHFYTGGHADYHKPTDDSDKINAVGGAKVVRLVYETARAVADREARLAFVPPGSSGDADRANPTFRVVMGLTPNYADDGGDGGMKVDAVSAEGPAALAGMQAEDVIVRINGKQIANIYDYMASTRNNKPGDTVEVVVRRGEEEMTLNVTLAGAG